MTPKFEPFLPTPRLSPLSALRWLKARIRAAEPTSVVRLGDGEFAMLGFGNEAPEPHSERSLRIWFGDYRPTRPALDAFASELRDAVRAADLIGLPRLSRQQAGELCSYIRPIFANHRLESPHQVFTDSGLHHFLQLALAFEELVRNLPFLGIISPRPLEMQLSSVFGIQEVVRYPIAAEFMTRESAASSELPHYPDRYEELRHGLKVPFRGAVFLVGAGAFGKVYCHWIQERGGIALDIGSLFDAWAGIASRQRISKLSQYMSLDTYSKPTTESERHARYRDVLRNFEFGISPSHDELEFLLS